MKIRYHINTLLTFLAAALTLSLLLVYCGFNYAKMGPRVNREVIVPETDISGQSAVAPFIPVSVAPPTGQQRPPALRWPPRDASDNFPRPPPPLTKFLEVYNYQLNEGKLPISADPENLDTFTEWWQAAALFSWFLHSPVSYKCSHIRRAHNWRFCQDEPYTITQPCLVYTFGIAFDFRFEEDMAEMGCDVRAHDPSMGLEDHQHSPNVMFYNLGIGGEDTDEFIPARDSYVTAEQKWKVRTLKTLLEERGHEDRTIDILKIDVETHEWTVLDNLIKTGMLQHVRQLLLEYHFFAARPPKEDYVSCLKNFRQLHKMGFKQFYSVPTGISIKEAYRHQGEVFYVNTEFSPTHGVPDIGR